uniref:ABC transporter permease n=1 Tax=Hylemonella sp. TaxID=2066020 RepID=UPI0035AEE360
MRSIAWNPLLVFAEIWRHRYLLGQLIKRDVLLRYRGAMFGVAWIFFSPLIMLAIFAFIFGHVFQARWPQQTDTMPFWVLLYVGLTTFNVFGETVARSPTSVRGYPNFVKKIVFPVEILPLVPLGAALVHACFNLLILAAALVWFGELRPQFLLLPILIAPVVMLAIGMSWFLSAWGVFIKDMNQIVPVLVQMLLYLSPVFYPASAVPPAFQFLYAHNPLSIPVEAIRNAVTGHPIGWDSWILALTIGLGVALAGRFFFQHSREEFADAL